MHSHDTKMAWHSSLGFSERLSIIMKMQASHILKNISLFQYFSTDLFFSSTSYNFAFPEKSTSESQAEARTLESTIYKDALSKVYNIKITKTPKTSALKPLFF